MTERVEITITRREAGPLEAEVEAVIRHCDSRLGEARPRFSPLFVAAMRERLAKALEQERRWAEESADA